MRARAGSFVCALRDTGIGMDAVTLHRIFEPFFTTKEVGKGTGLGLATVYGIVKQHEGWIEVNSEPDKGATFDVFFPASEKILAPKKKKPVLPEAALAGGTETILIVEDEPILREMARDILSGYGYRIFEASSGKEALDMWQQKSDEIDLLLTDMVMPEGISGAELARQLLASHPASENHFHQRLHRQRSQHRNAGENEGALSAKTLHPRRPRQNRPRMPG